MPKTGIQFPDRPFGVFPRTGMNRHGKCRRSPGGSYNDLVEEIGQVGRLKSGTSGSMESVRKAANVAMPYIAEPEKPGCKSPGTHDRAQPTRRKCPVVTRTRKVWVHKNPTENQREELVRGGGVSIGW